MMPGLHFMNVAPYLCSSMRRVTRMILAALARVFAP